MQLGSSPPVNDSRRRGHRRPWVWIAIGCGITLAVLAALTLVATVPFSSETLRKRLVATLSDRLDSEVDLIDARIRVLPQFRAEAFGLTIRHRGRRDVPPLIKIDKVSVESALANLLRKHVGAVTLTGLEINVPPDNDKADDHSMAVDVTTSAVVSSRERGGKDVVIDNLTATGARLVIIPKGKNKLPKVWEIHDLSMESVSFDRRMPFHATLTNAIPPGEIRVIGSFGPWQSGTPGATTLEGTFTFARADLGVFKGISGILSAHGEFGGTLGRLGVHGETDTPDFTVAVGGHPVPLHADYHTTVDGTNGDTLLDRIDASFLKTSLVAKGSVVGTPGKDGRTVTLDLVMDKARIEDVLRLAVKAPKAPMTGAMKMRTKFILPPGDRDVIEKLRLDGQFSIATARFTNIDIQKKVDELSRRSRGTKVEAGESSVVSDFSGRFKLGGGQLTLETLQFDTPGAQMQLAGSYALRPETLDFRGMLLMDATISETQKGWKRFALKIIDPLFAKRGGGGTELPIKIRGKRSDPSFGLDAGRLLRRGSADSPSASPGQSR